MEPARAEAVEQAERVATLRAALQLRTTPAPGAGTNKPVRVASPTTATSPSTSSRSRTPRRTTS